MTAEPTAGAGDPTPPAVARFHAVLPDHPSISCGDRWPDGRPAPMPIAGPSGMWTSWATLFPLRCRIAGRAPERVEVDEFPVRTLTADGRTPIFDPMAREAEAKGDEPVGLRCIAGEDGRIS